MTVRAADRSGISKRIVVGGIVVAALFVLSVFTLLIPWIEDRLVFERKQTLKTQTEIAWSVLAHYNELAQKNAISRDESMKTAAAVVAGLRYGPENKDYFWINDLHPTMVMHPYTPELIGKDLSTYRDPTGVAVFEEFVKVCREKGEGYASYSWQKQGDSKLIVPKTSYVRLFRPWNWIIGTGLYMDDLSAEIGALKTRIAMACIAIALFIIIVSWFLSRWISRSIAYTIAVADAAGGDSGKKSGLTCRLQTFILLVVVPALLILTTAWCAKFYSDLRGVITAGFDRKLIAISSTTGCFINGEDHTEIAGQTNENSELYQRHVRPMKEVMKLANLTYLYTQTLSDEKSYVSYVLDATEGKDHSAIGSKDQPPPDDYQGAEKVVNYGIVHLGQVQRTENWGMIKSSFAPIYSKDDAIVGMAGADVNVSIIDDKMRASLFAVALAGVVSLLLAGAISVFIARRLTNPIERLKEDALLVAAGSYGRQVKVESPLELDKLAGGVNSISNGLKDVLKELTLANETMEARKRRYDLTVALDKSDQDSLSWTDDRHALGWFNNKVEAKTASGWTVRGDKLVFWIANAVREPLDALKLRNDIAISAGCLLNTFGDDNDSLFAELGSLFPDDVKCFFFVRLASASTVHCLPRMKTQAAFMDGHGHADSIDISVTRELVIPPEKCLVVSDIEEYVSGQFIKDLGPGRRGDGPVSSSVFQVMRDRVESVNSTRQIMVGVLNG
ncbi:MAG: hypothetical protein C0404_04970 [Verrucomicrobia bacterium]|nr:hypothetical protein [Verrucomicrobiota bacterium]